MIHDHEDNTIIDVKRLDITRFKLRPNTHEIRIAAASLDSLVFKIHTAPGDSISNLAGLLQKFSSEETQSDTTAAPWSVSIARVSLNNAHFEDRNFNEKPIPLGIDWNHTVVSNLNGEIKNVNINDSLISAKVRHVDFNEISGFSVTAMKGDISYSPKAIMLENIKLKTTYSDLEFNYNLLYEDMSAFRDFINLVQMEGDFNLSRLALEDLVYFAPLFQGLNNFVWLSGSIKGTVSDLKANNMELIAGDRFRLLTDFAVKGLPDIEKTLFDINIKKLFTTTQDVTSFQLPFRESELFLELPENLDSLKYCSVTGFFTGYMKNFVAKADINTNLGDITTDIQLAQNIYSGELEYDGLISGKDIQAGLLAQQYDILGSLDVNIDVKGQGIDPETMNIRMDGSIDSLWFMDNRFNSIAINASYIDKIATGSVALNDELAFINIDGTIDLQKEEPYTFVDVVIENADLHGLHLLDSTNRTIISTNIHADAHGLKPDLINGTIIANNTIYTSNGDTLIIDEFEITQKSINDSSLHKVLTISSDVFDMYSTSSIPYSEVIPTITQYIRNIAPELLTTDTLAGRHSWSTENFIANIKFKNTRDVSRIFMPFLTFPPGARARLEYNGETSQTNFSFNAKTLNISGITVENINLESEIDSLRGDFVVRIDEVILMEPAEDDSIPIGLQNFMLTALAEQDTIHIQSEYDDFSTLDRNKGFMNAYLSLSSFPALDISIKENRLTFNDSTWKFHKNNRIHIQEGINKFVNVGIASKSQGFIINGNISQNPLDTLKASFNGMNLQLMDIFLPREIRLNGLLNGQASVSGIYQTPNLLGELSVDDFNLNNEHLGDLLITTTWNNKKNHIDVNADLIYTGNIGSDTTLFIHGYYAPTDNGYLDFDIKTKNFNVEVAKPWLDGVAHNISGRMSGKLKAIGTLDKPVLTGKLFFFRTGMRIDYTKVDYTFADEIHFTKNAITFKDFVINDSRANRLIVNGGLNHNYFDDFDLDLDLDFQDINVMQTRSMDNSSFYGNIFTSGNLKLKGLFDQMYLNANIRTVQGTNVHVPVTYSVNVGTNDFITFINPYDTTIIKEYIAPQPSGSGINIDTRIQVDPTTNLNIYLPDNMGSMEVNGYGDIRFIMDEQSDFEIFGDYEIASGKFLFTLQNVIRRSFDIRSGGTIKLAGDAMDAELDIKAVYHLRAGLSGLPTADTTLSGRRIPVECVLGLSGPVINPIINFSIELPDADEQIRDLIYSTIDTTNHTMMTQQMLSLLILNSFTFSNTNTALTGGLGNTSFDILTNQLSNWISQISKDFDVGINYRPGDEITQEEVEVALRTQLFNDRVIIDGNIGVMNAENTENTSNIVGDVNVEVKITKDGRLRFKAFNKSNEYDMLNNASPYTQGIGISYFTEFDNFGDLFGRKSKVQKRE